MARSSILRAFRHASGLLVLLLAIPAPAQLPDPTALITATTSQAPLTSIYQALNVPGLRAGQTYREPTSGLTVYKLTSSSFPTSGFPWGHDYSEGGNEISLPYTGDGKTRAVYLNGGGNQANWIIDLVPGVGVSNPRNLAAISALNPNVDGCFTFSSNPATPWYAYVCSGSAVKRLDVRTMQEAPGGGWPVSEPGQVGPWLHQSQNDGRFVWMRGSSTFVLYEPATQTKKVLTDGNANEPRIDREDGRYVGLAMNSPNNGLRVWDWNSNSIVWEGDGCGDPNVPFAHNGSLRRLWIAQNWNLSEPRQFSRIYPDVPNSCVDIGGSGPVGGGYVSGNWINFPASGNRLDQWWLTYDYGKQDSGSIRLAHGGAVYATATGQRRFVAHFYSTQSTYFAYAWAKSSSDGQFIIFTSDMLGSGRYDLFAIAMPTTGGGGPPPGVTAVPSALTVQ